MITIRDDGVYRYIVDGNVVATMQRVGSEWHVRDERLKCERKHTDRVQALYNLQQYGEAYAHKVEV